MTQRAAGILLHISSLPTFFGIGDLGPSAYDFVDYLRDGGQKYWQVLPINPTNLTYGNSPYSCSSSFAGNPLFISLELMIEDGFLTISDLKNIPKFPEEKLDYSSVCKYKNTLLRKAFEQNRHEILHYPDFDQFSINNKKWLDDYCLYESIKMNTKYSTWHDFPAKLKNREQAALDFNKDDHRDNILYNKFLQFIFYKQWNSLKEYANRKGILIIGDMPYYVNYDSPEVWSSQNLFKLDEDGNPECVAGVPPDYFSETGQLWGNPVYNWDRMKENEYAWWIDRIGHNLLIFDKFRLDHFRGFVSYWEVDAQETTAQNGKWVDLDPYAFFDHLFSKYPKAHFIAEDLGFITDDVREVIKHYGLPGMKILLFAFGDDYPSSAFLPSNIKDQNCFVYTGTHDNNTVRGWWDNEATQKERRRVKEYLQIEVSDKKINWEFIKLALGSNADTVIIPLQDILGLGESARMNTPATTSGNWIWKLESKDRYIKTVEKLRALSENVDRV